MMVDDPFWEDFSRQHPAIVSRTIPVGVDAPARVTDDARKSYRDSLGIPDDARVVTTIGRLVSERRPRSYIPVFEQISKSLGPNVHFVMGGDGPERAAVEADAKAAGLVDRLHMPGLVAQIEMPLSISDLYLTANVGPTPGVAGLQAIAAGVPTIAVQLSDDYQAPSTDWIWSSRDLGQIGARASQMLGDQGKADALAREQRAYLDAHHSASAMAAAYEQFYRDALAKVRSA